MHNLGKHLFTKSVIPPRKVRNTYFLFILLFILFFYPQHLLCTILHNVLDSREVEAAKYDLNYIGLDGNIGCMVNGAGLAMSTMDIIQLKGGSPANFLDVGGGANEEQVQKAFEILNADPNVQAILVNIFGGIMRCDVIAVGIINAAKEIGMKKPLVIRLQGTNVEEAKSMIDGCGFRMILANDLDDAAEKAVGVAEIAKRAEALQLGIKFEGLSI